MTQLELDLETREEKLARFAFRIGFRRGYSASKYGSSLSTLVDADDETEQFIQQWLATPQGE